jgi:hypothetical protein
MNKEKISQDIILYKNIFNDYKTVLSELNNSNDVVWKKSFTAYVDYSKVEDNLYYSYFTGGKDSLIERKSRSLAISIIKPVRDYLSEKGKDLEWVDDFLYEKITNIEKEQITINSFLIIESFDFYLIYFFEDDDVEINFKNNDIKVKSKKNSVLIFPLNKNFDFSITKYGNVDSYYATLAFK